MIDHSKRALLRASGIGYLQPTLPMPGSKASSLRALWLGGLAQDSSVIHNFLHCDDTAVMMNALQSLGAILSNKGSALVIERGIQKHTVPEFIDLKESGLTFRLLASYWALHGSAPLRLTGQGRLLQRPMKGLFDALAPWGITTEHSSEALKIYPKAPDRPVVLNIESGVTSQWLSGLAISLSQLPQGGRLAWFGDVVSQPYLELTSYWMNKFGMNPRRGETFWDITHESIRGGEKTVEGDWSSAAPFILAAAFLKTSITLSGLGTKEPQGDRNLLEIISPGIKHHWQDNLLVIHGLMSEGIHCDLSETPDLAPVIAAACVFTKKTSHLYGLRTLRDKESDRFLKIQELIEWLGGHWTSPDNGSLIIHPKVGQDHPLYSFDPSNDHRIAFAAALGGLQVGGVLLDSECVQKSFPEFWSLWEAMLGTKDSSR